MQASKIQILGQAKDGIVFICNSCDKIHVEYKSFVFNFSRDEFESFRQYFRALDIPLLLSRNEGTRYQSKIAVPIGSRAFTVLFDQSEIAGFVSLLNGQTQYNIPLVPSASSFASPYQLN